MKILIGLCLVTIVLQESFLCSNYRVEHFTSDNLSPLPSTRKTPHQSSFIWIEGQNTSSKEIEAVIERSARSGIRYYQEMSSSSKASLINLIVKESRLFREMANDRNRLYRSLERNFRFTHEELENIFTRRLPEWLEEVRIILIKDPYSPMNPLLSASRWNKATIFAWEFKETPVLYLPEGLYSHLNDRILKKDFISMQAMGLLILKAGFQMILHSDGYLRVEEDIVRASRILELSYGTVFLFAHFSSDIEQLNYYSPLEFYISELLVKFFRSKNDSRGVVLSIVHTKDFFDPLRRAQPAIDRLLGHPSVNFVIENVTNINGLKGYLKGLGIPLPKREFYSSYLNHLGYKFPEHDLNIPYTTELRKKMFTDLLSTPFSERANIKVPITENEIILVGGNCTQCLLDEADSWLFAIKTSSTQHKVWYLHLPMGENGAIYEDRGFSKFNPSTFEVYENLLRSRMGDGRYLGNFGYRLLFEAKDPQGDKTIYLSIWLDFDAFLRYLDGNQYKISDIIASNL